MSYQGITDHDHAVQVTETLERHERWKRAEGEIRGRVTVFADKLGQDFPDHVATLAEQLEAAARNIRERHEKARRAARVRG